MRIPGSPRQYPAFMLTTQGLAQVRLGRYAQAETTQRERETLPQNPFSAADPQDERSRLV